MSRLEVAYHPESQQENQPRRAGKNHQRNINSTMKALLASATDAGRKMLLVIATHLRRNAGNVLTPSRQDVTHDRVNTALTHALAATAESALRAPNGMPIRPYFAIRYAGFPRHVRRQPW